MMPTKIVDEAAEANALRAVLEPLLPAGWSQAWVRAEVQEGTGVVDVYVEEKTGSLRHLTSVRGLTMKVFEWAHAMPARADASQRSWTICAAHCSRGGGCSLRFGYDDISDVAMAADRREAFERATFGARELAYDPF